MSKAFHRDMLRFIQKNVNIYPNGHLVSRSSDYIIYSVEAKNINDVVAKYGPCKRVQVFTLNGKLTASAYSYEAWCNCRRANIVQGT